MKAILLPSGDHAGSVPAAIRRVAALRVHDVDGVASGALLKAIDRLSGDHAAPPSVAGAVRDVGLRAPVGFMT